MARGLTEILAALARCGSRSGTLALIGAAARNAWAPPRATTDLDLAVSAADPILESIQGEREVLRRAVPVDIGGIVFPVATPEDLIVYKLIADRPRDRDDIGAILRTQARAGRALDWAYVERWARFWNVHDRLVALREGG